MLQKQMKSKNIFFHVNLGKPFIHQIPFFISMLLQSTEQENMMYKVAVWMIYMLTVIKCHFITGLYVFVGICIKIHVDGSGK